MNQKQKKYIVIALVALFVVTPLIMWIISLAPGPTQGAALYTVPGKVKVAVDGGVHTVSYGKTLALNEGEYTLDVSADGFEPAKATVIVKPDEIAKVCVALTPITNEARRRINTQQQEEVAGCLVADGAREFEEKYPFMKNIPATSKYFKVYPCKKDDADKNSPYIVCVKFLLDNQVQRELAVQLMQERGIDVDKVEVRYIPPEAPRETKGQL